jgi:hypothetical protein
VREDTLHFWLAQLTKQSVSWFVSWYVFIELLLQTAEKYIMNWTIELKMISFINDSS